MESLISYVDRVEQKSDKLVAIWVASQIFYSHLSQKLEPRLATAWDVLDHVPGDDLLTPLERRRGLPSATSPASSSPIPTSTASTTS